MSAPGGVDVSRNIWNMLVTKAVKMCATCGKSVSSVSYARHLRSHAAGTYVCEHCDEVFKNNYGLKRHVLTRHASTDERPLVCSVCEQRFARREHLDAHCARVHLNEAREQIEACLWARGVIVRVAILGEGGIFLDLLLPSAQTDRYKIKH